MTTEPGVPHEFVPFPIDQLVDRQRHVCRGGCYCAACGERKSSRTDHYQDRDRRRPTPADVPIPRGAHGAVPSAGGRPA